MPWYKITAGTKVYVRDPAKLLIRDEHGRFLTPAELLATWRAIGTVEQLPEGVDPEAVAREGWTNS